MLKDLYPTSSGGDLQVTIEESDGSKTQYTVPFASVPNLVRSGQIKYALGAGKASRRRRPEHPDVCPRESCFSAGNTASPFTAARSLQSATAGLALGVGQNLGRFGA
nr:type 1 fimbriae anchoring protein FimD [Raoultella sp. NCTC 9187]